MFSNDFQFDDTTGTQTILTQISVVFNPYERMLGQSFEISQNHFLQIVSLPSDRAIFVLYICSGTKLDDFRSPYYCWEV
jgi:hypothetical protein